MGLLDKVRSGEVDTPEEVAKALNKIIDKVNENEEHNAAIDAENEEARIFNEEIDDAQEAKEGK